MNFVDDADVVGVDPGQCNLIAIVRLKSECEFMDRMEENEETKKKGNKKKSNTKSYSARLRVTAKQVRSESHMTWWRSYLERRKRYEIRLEATTRDRVLAV